MDTTSLFQDLAVILVAVGAASAVCARFKWPKVLGYMFAGVLLGRHTFGGSFVVNESSIAALGQLGVVFLMFTLGLEFSLPKLRKVGHVAVPTALLDMAVMIWAGHFVGTRLLGWGSLQSLFLGVAISDSATTVLAKTLGEMGWATRRFAKYVFGVTLTEDLLCVGALALLTGLARSGTMRAAELAQSLGALALFLTAVTVFGLLLVPRALDRVAKLKDDETLLLTMLGFCFLVSFAAAKLNFSLALGAFLVGVMGAESAALKRIYHQCVPLRTLFSAIFFMTVGLLVDPAEMITHGKAICGLALLVIVGKGANCTLGALLSGLDLKTAVQTGAGLAQIGEFAYLVALIGVGVDGVEGDLYPVAVGVSVLTTLANPFVLRASDPFAAWLERRLPESWRDGLETYANWTDRFRHSPVQGEVARALRLDLALALLQLVLVAAFFVTAGILSRADFGTIAPWAEAYKKPLLWGAACLLTVPNAIFLLLRSRGLGHKVAEALLPAKLTDTPWALAFRRFAGFFCMVAGGAALFLEIVLLSGTIMPEEGWARAVVAGALLAVGAIGWKRFRHLGAESLTALKAVLAKETEIDPTDTTAELLDVHTERMTLEAECAGCGLTLRELGLRTRCGASVIGVERDGKTVMNPTADERLAAGDTLLVLGDDEQLAAAREVLRRDAR